MTMFFHCKKAELTHPDTGAVHRAAVSADGDGDLLVTLPQDTEFPAVSYTHLTLPTIVGV